MTCTFSSAVGSESLSMLEGDWRRPGDAGRARLEDDGDRQVDRHLRLSSNLKSGLSLGLQSLPILKGINSKIRVFVT